jgi:hypothetical protein
MRCDAIDESSRLSIDHHVCAQDSRVARLPNKRHDGIVGNSGSWLSKSSDGAARPVVNALYSNVSDRGSEIAVLEGQRPSGESFGSHRSNDN